MAERVCDAPSLPMGDDGAPMTRWQIWLQRLCRFVIVWAVAELAVGVVLWGGYAAGGLFWADAGQSAAEPAVGLMALLGSVLNLVLGVLGLRSARDPGRITLFFWIVFLDAMLTVWALASSLSYGSCDLTSLVSGLLVVALAVCAWQVRGQTGYFDVHP